MATNPTKYAGVEYIATKRHRRAARRWGLGRPPVRPAARAIEREKHRYSMRLDRYISQATGHSRSESRTLIRQGRVRLGGHVVATSSAAVGADDEVSLDGVVLLPPGPLYLMLNKPAGVISATRDSGQATVVDLLPRETARRVHPVGRLDKATTGLLLLTDDGAWSHRVASPRHRCLKLYRARLAEPFGDADAARLLAGVQLRGDATPFRPALLERVSETEVLVGVTEGRYHLVRRLFGALGNRVTELHREQIGGLRLDPALPPGGWRPLSEAERDAVLSGPSPGND
jgi:16S rRNA pseudouridine516 synthase